MLFDVQNLLYGENRSETSDFSFLPYVPDMTSHLKKQVFSKSIGWKHAWIDSRIYLPNRAVCSPGASLPYEFWRRAPASLQFETGFSVSPGANERNPVFWENCPAALRFDFEKHIEVLDPGEGG